MNKFQFAMAQIGHKQERSRSLAMLLGQSDLPGKWGLQKQRSWRSGASGHSGDEYRRAHRLGYYSAVRTFKQTETSRWMLAQLMPFESINDAAASMVGVPALLQANSKAKVAVMSEQTIQGLEVPGVDHPWVFEKISVGQKGLSATRYLAGNVDRIVFLLQCTGLGDGWLWNEVVEIAGIQALKIGQMLK